MCTLTKLRKHSLFTPGAAGINEGGCYQKFRILRGGSQRIMHRKGIGLSVFYFLHNPFKNTKMLSKSRKIENRRVAEKRESVSSSLILRRQMSA
jgi:hypothetical protein